MAAVSQHLEALAKMRQINAGQAAVRRELRDGGRELAASLLREPTCAVKSFRLDRFLIAIPRYGDWRARRALRDADMHPGRISRQVRELTADERHRLAAVIES